MVDLVVKSNFARNNVILLDGKYPLHFNADGVARLPVALRSAFEREALMKPGRFWIVEEPVVAAAEPVQAEQEVEEKQPEADKAPVEEVEEKPAAVKAARKK